MLVICEVGQGRRRAVKLPVEELGQPTRLRQVQRDADEQTPLEIDVGPTLQRPRRPPITVAALANSTQGSITCQPRTADPRRETHSPAWF